jgi:lipoprotein-anchoring transpeptidase ErfK/SrfK
VLSALRGHGGGARLITGSVIALLGVLTLADCGSSDHTENSPRPAAQATKPLSSLPQATTFTTIKGLATDNDLTAGNGTVVHVRKTVPVSATPGGPPVAALPAKELGNPTWVPEIGKQAGFLEVLLPNRPNRSAGWIPTSGNAVQTAHTSYVVKVNTSARQLTLLHSGKQLGKWTVAVGAAKTPTPPGRTFLLASLSPQSKERYSPLILPLGTHSTAYDNFGGGPGTVALHGWLPDASVFGKAISNGCVRVPEDLLTQLSRVPLGSMVLISS